MLTKNGTEKYQQQKNEERNKSSSDLSAGLLEEMNPLQRTVVNDETRTFR
jgi:hypothetical protein